MVRLFHLLDPSIADEDVSAEQIYFQHSITQGAQHFESFWLEMIPRYFSASGQIWNFKTVLQVLSYMAAMVSMTFTKHLFQRRPSEGPKHECCPQSLRTRRSLNFKTRKIELTVMYRRMPISWKSRRTQFPQITYKHIPFKLISIPHK